MSNIEPKNVWEANSIPSLDFCSIKRASELLKCSESDISHWIQMRYIRPAIFFDSWQKVELTIYSFNDAISADDMLDLVRDAARHLSTFLIMRQPESQKSSDTGSSEDNKNVASIKKQHKAKEYHTTISCSISGLWLPRISFKTHGSIIEIQETTFFYLPREEHDQCYVSCTIDSPMLFNHDDILITKSDIERIYDAGRQGKTLGRYETTKINDAEIEEVKFTVHQADMIYGLMKLLGFSDDEIKNKSPSDLNSKLTKLATKKSISCRTPDPKTWEKWRKKMN
ncbi:TPA: hypothetical protein ACSTL2_000385 [Morganella morganii]